MTLHYSKSVDGFFDTAIHRTLPADAVEISRDEHAALLDAQANGKRIVADRNGRPVAQAPAQPPIAERRAEAVAAIKREARRRILAIASLERQANDAAAIALSTYSAYEHPDVGDAVGRRLQIDAIRIASDALEAKVAALNAGALATLSITDDAHWQGA